MLNFETCPTNVAEIGELYSMGLLDPAEAAAFEEHYIACEKCAAVVVEMDAYTLAMKTAALQLRGAETLSASASVV